MNTALFDLIERHKIDPAKVKKVRIALSPPAFDLHGKLARYKGKFDALISGHYTAAVILHDQQLTLEQFEPARYDDPAMPYEVKRRRGAAFTHAYDYDDYAQLARIQEWLTQELEEDFR